MPFGKGQQKHSLKVLPIVVLERKIKKYERIDMMHKQESIREYFEMGNLFYT